MSSKRFLDFNVMQEIIIVDTEQHYEICQDKCLEGTYKRLPLKFERMSSDRMIAL